jgi:biotin carboxyl carrier protein
VSDLPPSANLFMSLVDDARSLLRTFAPSDAEGFSCNLRADTTLNLTKTQTQAVQQICAPHVGTVETVEKVGTSVQIGEVVFVMNVLDILHEILAPYDLEIDEILADVGFLVEFGNPIVSVVRR